MNLSKKIGWGFALAILALSFYLRLQAIEGMAPTFDEPFRILQAVHFKQFGVEYMPDVHSPFPSWLLSQTLGFLADFENLNFFLKNTQAFTGPYQYRMDLLSHTSQDTLLIRIRWVCQIFWLLAGIGLLSLAKNWGSKRHQLLLFSAFFWLEPSFLGLSSLLCLDIQVVFWLVLGTFLFMRSEKWEWALGLLCFSFACATKLTALLWVAPLLLGLWLKKIPKRVLISFVFSPLLSFLFCYLFFGFDPFQEKLLASNFRTTYLDGVSGLKPAFLYFLQVFLNKVSYAGLALLIFSIVQGIRNPNQARNKSFLLFFTAFFLAGFILPGLGLRLILPIVVCAFFLLSFETTPKIAYALIVILMIEALCHRNQELSHQNLFAGTTPRSLDSDLDWGQGLKALALWRQQNLEGELALSLFGGTPPETYGINQYRALPSFPTLASSKTIDSGRFSGFVAVSRNFLYGYIVQDHSLIILKDRTPLHCFHGALCLYDVRDSK